MLEPHESDRGFKIFLSKSHQASASNLLEALETELSKRGLLSREDSGFVRVDIKAEEEIGILFVSVGIRGSFYYSFHTPLPF